MRQNKIARWLEDKVPGYTGCEAIPGDASVRAYYRVRFGDNDVAVLMDAHRQPEVILPFVSIAKALAANGVHAPEICVADEAAGLVLLEDLGDVLLLDVLTADSVDAYYQKAIDTLVRLQACPAVAGYRIPLFGKTICAEESYLFTHWFCTVHCRLTLTDAERALLEQAFSSLLDNALSQPQVLVHRDYHSRNLLVLPDGELGVIDFQDAVKGPVTYDLLSLLRDCYVAWPRERVLLWVDYFYSSIQHSLPSTVTLAQFVAWFDLMGLQRYLKCIGIFSRLNARDGKPNYLQHIPRILRYVLEVCRLYPEYHALGSWMEDKFTKVVT